MSIKHLSALGTSIGAVDKLLTAGNLTERYNALKEVKTAVVSLNAAETTSLLVSNNVNKAHAISILMSKGMTKEMAKETLAEATNTTAKTANTVATFSLSAAYKGLAASIGISTAALTWWIAGIAAVGVAAYAFVKIHKSVEDYRKAAEAAAEENEELKSSIESINSELETTKSKMDELEKQGSLSFVEQEELQKLRDTTAELKRQLEVKTALQKVADEDARETAIDYLNTSGGQYRYGGWDMSQVENGNQRYGQAIDSLYTDNRVVATEQMISDYQELIKRQEELNTLKADFIKNNPQGYADEDTYRNVDMESVAVDNALSMLKANIPKAIEELDKFDDSLDLEKDESLISQINSIQDAFSGLFGGKATSVTDNFNSVWESDSFKQYRTELERMALSGEIERSVLTSNENYRKLLDATGATAEEVAQNIESLVAEMERAGQIDFGFGDTFSKSEMISAINELSEGFESLDKIMASINSEDPFDYSLLDDSKFKETFSELGDSYADFIDKISNSPKDINACQSAFDDLLTAWVNSTNVLDGLSDETADLTINMLSNMGVANAEEVVTSALIEKHAQLAAEKYYNATASAALEGATANETIRILEEADAAGISTQYLAQLELAKIAVNGVTIDTNSDIDQIINLANAAGSSASALYQLAAAKAAVGGSALVDPTSGSYDRFAALEGERVKHSLETGKFDYQFESIDSSKFKSVAYGGGSNTRKSSGSGGSSGKGSGGGSGSGLEKEPTEFDWMPRRIEVIDKQVDKLREKIEKLVGYKAKNSNTNTVIDLMTEKMSILQQMHDRYMSEADKIGLTQEYIDKIQSGIIDIESISDEVVASQINNYKEWYEKAEDVSTQINEVNKSIHDLNISKLDNIIEQFENLSDIQSQLIDTEEQLLDLREHSGETIYADDYLSLGEKQLELTKQNLDAYNALAAEMSKLNLKRGSEEWKTYNDQLQEYKNNMISAADAVEQYKDAMTDLVYKELDDFKSKMDSINGTISTMNSLIGDVNLIDDSGNLTDRGLAQVALYAQQLANAKQESANYAEAIQSLDEALDSGLITQDEYNERLYEYTSAQESAVQSTKDAKDAMIALVKEGIQAQIDAKRKLTDETIAALEAEQNLYKYQNEINEKQKNITTLQKKIASLAGATSGTELATRLKLEQELLEAQKDLYDTQYDHNIEQQKNALNEAYDAYEKEKQDEMDELDSNLAAQEKAIEKYLSDVKKNYSTVYDVLTQYGNEYSLSAIDDLTSPWESGSDAANLCANAIGDAISTINYEISNIDMSPLYELIEALNSIGEYGMGGSSSQFEDVTSQGEWKKSSGRWWYGNSSDDYVSGGVYTIDGKQYGFGDDGYMLEGWNDDTGEWRYFEPSSGVMTRSEWKQDKKGNWYYLDKDGAMVTDSAVKAKSGDGYYYVNDSGIWDGETLTYDYIKKRGLIVAYKKGTRRVATDQLAWTQEEAPEIITRPSDSSILVPLKANDGVIKGSLTDNLMKMATDPSSFMQQISMPSIANVASREALQINFDMPVNIEGNADEKTLGLMHDMMIEFTKNEMFNVIKKSGYKYRK